MTRQHPQSAKAAESRREHALVHAALFRELYGLLQELNDRSLSRRDIATELDSLITQIRECKDLDCLTMNKSRKRVRLASIGRWGSYGLCVPPGKAFTLTAEQIREWRKGAKR